MNASVLFQPLTGLCLLIMISFATPVAYAQSESPTRLAAGQPTALNAMMLFERAPEEALRPALTTASPSILGLAGNRISFMLMKTQPRLMLENFPLPNGTSVDIELSSFMLFDEQTVFIAMTSAGEVRRPAPDITFYRGAIHGEPNSWAYLAVEQEGMSGTIISKGVTYNVWTEGSQQSRIVHVFESTNEMRSFDCGIDERNVLHMMGSTKENRTAAIAEDPDTLVAQIAIDADQAAQIHYGGTAQCEAYVLARMGESSAIYERDLVIKLKIPFMRIWETLDPFPGNSDIQLLNVFTNYWKENMDAVPRTLAALISRKPISANGVAQGVAWLDQLCSKERGYSITKFSGNNGFIEGHVGVLAHEIGHNFGSPHTHSCWWDPPVDSCYTAEPKQGQAPCFSAADRHLILGGGEMMSYCHLSFGNRNKYNIFRERVGTHVRNRAEAAQCIIVVGRPPMLTLTAPVGSEEYCTGTDVPITWTAQVNNDLSILLSRNNGANFDTVLVGDLDRTARSWTWKIPSTFPPGDFYRIRIKDNRNDTLVSEMSSSFTIKPGTVILTQVLWRNVCVGQGANFNLTASGPGTLTYQWKRNGTDLPGKTTNNLQLEGMTLADDSALFTCVVTSECGPIESEPALLRVFDKPRILQHPTNDTVCAGGKATLRIIAEGPALSYRWLTVGKVYEVNSPEFTIDNVTQTTSFFCEVTSACGVINTNTGFVIVPQPSVSFLSPSPFQELTVGSTFDINWRAFCLGKLKVEYSTNGGTSWMTIADSVASENGTHRWLVPSTLTTNGVFRLTDTKNGSVTKISPTFRIVARPTLVLNPTEVSFGLVEVGTTATQNVQIGNAGSATLNVTKAEITGTQEVTVVNAIPFSVDIGSQTNLQLKYAPTASERMEGNLRIEHDAPGSPSIVRLVGDAFIMTSTNTLPKPTVLALHQNYPNPVSLSSSASSRLTFDLPKTGHVRITLFNALGSELRTVLEGVREAGRHEIALQLTGLPAGTYLVRLSAAGRMITRVMHVVK